ncbi:unnamed protein product [Victoria cruziana]
MDGEVHPFKRLHKLSTYEVSDGSPMTAVQACLPRRWLIVAGLLVLQFVLLTVFGWFSSPVAAILDASHLSPAGIPVPVETPAANSSASSSLTSTGTELAEVSSVSSPKLCLSPGKVYVYDLPPVFNRELIENCNDLSPWGSRCTMLENGGFGRKANLSGGTVPEDLLGAWFATDQFAAELIFHNRMLQHPCRTMDPATATAFFVPFYGGLAVGKYLWKAGSGDRDRHCQMLLEWLREQEWWRRSSGLDHFLMLGRITWDFRRSKDEDWGGSFLYMPGMENVTRLLIERNPWDEMDVAVPYPTSFHPRQDADVEEWRSYVRSVARPTLFSFAGATRTAFRDDFRGVLLRQCREAGNRCRSVDCRVAHCANDTSATLGLFMDSQFCLQPRGDSFTRRSIFDCMVAGSIPVFFWRRTAYFQYTWHLPRDPASYSVFIDRRDVKNGTSIERILSSLSPEKVRAMRETILETLPRLVYAASGDGLNRSTDAFDISLDGVLRRFHRRKTVDGDR